LANKFYFSHFNIWITVLGLLMKAYFEKMQQNFICKIRIKCLKISYLMPIIYMALPLHNTKHLTIIQTWTRLSSTHANISAGYYSGVLIKK